jgi:SAM-dependent methyltransferase
VAALAGLRPGDRLLEIGAGTGLIGRWLAERLAVLPAAYLGADLSRGMLEVFRRRLNEGERLGLAGEATGCSKSPKERVGRTEPVPARLVQIDGTAPWPLPDGAVRAVFSSRAIHLLPLGHAAAELRRVVGEGGACVLGWVERRPESVKARMSREMQRRLRERGFAARSAGSRPYLAALEQQGALRLPRTVVASWPVGHSPRRSLDDWGGKTGLGGIVLPPGVQEEVLDELAAWAVATFGGLDVTVASEEAYVLDGVRL